MPENNLDMPKDNLGLSVIAAIVAAIVGGIVWAIIAITMNYELAIVAWGIGGLAGYAVSIPSKDNITAIHKIVAVLASLFGIALGKYIFFSNQFRGGLFDSHTINVFFKNLGLYFGAMDILFVILAVVTAWQIPSQFNAPKETELTEDMIESETESVDETAHVDSEHQEDQSAK